MYSYEFTLKRTGFGEWSLFSSTGVKLYTMHRCADSSDALVKASAWASSWSSVNIKVVEDEHKDQ